jgi:AraC-like DNA-binding protein/heat shock protein HspQ
MLLHTRQILFTLLLFFTAGSANGQNLSLHASSDSERVEWYKNWSAQQILDTGKYFYGQNNLEKTLVYLSLLFDIDPQYADVEHQKILSEAYYRSAIIHYYMDNFRVSYDLALKAMQLSEAIGETDDHRAGIYVVMANIYNRLNRPDLTKIYLTKAISIRQDSSFMALVLNNLGSAYVDIGELDSAFILLEQSREIAERHRPDLLSAVWNNKALLYKAKKMYDSAFINFRLSLDEAKKSDNKYITSATYSDLGKLFFELNQPDSAMFYLNLSNSVAIKYNFKTFLMDNFQFLSKIAEAKGEKKQALDYLKQYIDLKDSTRGYDEIVEINQLQRFYDISQTNRQIEKLTLEQHFKQKIIRYQYVMLISVVCVLIVVFAQNRKLNKAYRNLFKKNIENIELQSYLAEKQQVKYQKSFLRVEQQNELLQQIYAVMEDTEVICDPEFSVEKLANMLQTNRTYISQIINETLNKNFRTFINDYRIREAQRLFSEDCHSKFTIEFISRKTGFKSRTSFIAAFKEVTGLSPSFYLKSMQEG